jgi:hypothetical protein
MQEENSMHAHGMYPAAAETKVIFQSAQQNAYKHRKQHPWHRQVCSMLRQTRVHVYKAQEKLSTAASNETPPTPRRT